MQKTSDWLMSFTTQPRANARPAIGDQTHRVGKSGIGDPVAHLLGRAVGIEIERADGGLGVSVEARHGEEAAVHFERRRRARAAIVGGRFG